MRRYKICIDRSDEDQAFVADVPELPGCMAHAESCGKAMVNAREAIALWIDSAQGQGASARRLAGSV